MLKNMVVAKKFAKSISFQNSITPKKKKGFSQGSFFEGR